MIPASVINVYGTVDHRIGVGEDNMIHIAFQLPQFCRFEDGFLWPAYDMGRILSIQQAHA